jgi:hypothetical protein
MIIALMLTQENQAKSGVCEREREREREIHMAQSSHCDVRTIDNILLCQLKCCKCVHVWTHPWLLYKCIGMKVFHLYFLKVHTTLFWLPFGLMVHPKW